MLESLVFDAMVESGGGPAPSWTSGVDGHGTVLAFSWLPWQHGEIKSRRDGPRTGNRHFILKKVKFYFKIQEKKVTVPRYLIFSTRGPPTPTF